MIYNIEYRGPGLILIHLDVLCNRLRKCLLTIKCPVTIMNAGANLLLRSADHEACITPHYPAMFDCLAIVSIAHISYMAFWTGSFLLTHVYYFIGTCTCP